MFRLNKNIATTSDSASKPLADNHLQRTDHGPALPHRTQQLLGITVLLSQLPLMFHLPLWLSLPGMGLVAAKAFSKPEKTELAAGKHTE